MILKDRFAKNFIFVECLELLHYYNLMAFLYLKMHYLLFKDIRNIQRDNVLVRF